MARAQARTSAVDGADAVEFEDSRVPVLDHDGGPGQCGEFGQGIAELAAGEAGHQISQGLAFDGGDQPPLRGDAVVAAGECAFDGADLLAGEVVGVLAL